MTPPDAGIAVPAGRRVVRAAVWLPGLAVAVGAAVATAHGLFEVAAAAGVPGGIAWLYPLITDGLALVAYVATARLTAGPARYAWSVVVLAAGLSGLAQAAYLAGGATLDASPALRFGVGAWPAVAAAVAAHLLHLLASEHVPGPAAVNIEAVQPEPNARPAVQPGPGTTPDVASVDRLNGQASELPPGERARAAALRHAARHGGLPTVTELERLAAVSRGTAATALKALREHPTPLHLVPDTPEPETQP